MSRVREAYREWAEKYTDARHPSPETPGAAFEAGYAAALPRLRSELVARLAADKEIRFAMAERILRHFEDAVRSLGGE